LNGRPSDQAAGRSNQKAKISRATARLTRRSDPRAPGDCGEFESARHRHIDVSEAVPPERQVTSGFRAILAVERANPDADPIANPSATDRCQRGAVAPTAGGKRLWATIDIGRCEP